jgi:trimeric autotransporter adhesin
MKQVLRIILTILTLTASHNLFAQVQGKFGNTQSALDVNAALEVESTSKGVLLPRLTTAQQNAMSAPTNGMLIYNTDSACFVLRRAGIWRSLCAANGGEAWSTLGNTGTNANTNFIGTTDNIPLSIRVNNVRSGYLSQNATTLGYEAGLVAPAANQVTFIGAGAGRANSTGNYNIAVGTNALNLNTVGGFNTAIGYATLVNNTSNYNTALGTSALMGNTTGATNTAVGTYALTSNSTGSENVAVGSNSLNTNSTGADNTGIGFGAMYNNTTGANNTGTGAYALTSNTTGVNNAAVGYAAMSWNATGSRNATLGMYAGYGISGGNYNDNSFFGYYAGSSISSGSSNVGIGSEALRNNTTAWSNTALGFRAGYGIQTGQANTVLGDSAFVSTTTGSNNVGVGYRAGIGNVTGTNNTIIGTNANVASNALTNATAIGANATVSASNSLVLGNLVNVGINTGTPQYKLDIDANTGSSGNPLRLQGLQAGTTTDSILTSASGVVRQLSINAILNNAWQTLGNTGTNAATNFAGTTDAQNFVIKANNKTRIRAGATDAYGVYLDNYATSAGGHSAVVSTLDFRTNAFQAQNNARVHFNSMVLGAAGSTGTQTVSLNQADLQAAGAFATVRGVATNLLLSNTATLTDYTHFFAGGTITNSTITDYYGLRVNPTISGGTMTNAYGVDLTTPAFATNYTGVRIGSITPAAGTQYAFLYNSTANPVAINASGNLGIGTTTPQYKLDINAQTGASGNPARLLGLNAGATSDSILSSSSGILRRLSISQVIGNAWNILGNAGTVDGTNFIGTTDNIPFNIRVNNQKAGRIDHLTNNTFFGYQAGNVSTGQQNTFVGSLAGLTNTTGFENTAIGNLAFNSNTTGQDNVAVGQDAMRLNTSGSTNVAVGESSLEFNTIGVRNVAVGSDALNSNTTASDNLALGHRALYNQSFANSGTAWLTDNIALGSNALYYNQPTNNSNGYRNIGIGRKALELNTTGSSNIAIGYESGNTNTTGSNITLLGFDTDVSSTGLTNATAIGANATVGASNSLVLGSNVNVGINTTTPQYKLDIDAQTGSSGNPMRLLGLNAGATSDSIVSSNSGILRRLSVNQILANAWNITGNTSTVDGTNFIGTTDNVPLSIRVFNQKAGRIGNTTDQVTSFGYQALNMNTAVGSTAFGYQAGLVNSTGVRNTLLGYQSGAANTIATDNSAVGYAALANNTTAGYNVALGSNALFSQSFNNAGTAWGANNVAIGFYALYANQPTLNTNGIGNIAVGTNVLRSNTTGSFNAALGNTALFTNVTGSYNSAFGSSTLFNNTASNNTAFGASALLSNTSGAGNVGLGVNVLYKNTIGANNIAIGLNTFQNNTAASNNIAIGSEALQTQSFNNAGTAWDAENIGIGFRALFFNQPTTSSNAYRNIAIGRNALYLNTTGASNVALGYQAGNVNTTGSNNTFIGATADVSSAALSNTTALGYGAIVDASNKIRLGNASVTLVETYGSFVTVSDKRLKTNINDNFIGLNFIKAVRPVQYELKTQKGIVYDGFVAQEIDSIMQKQGIKNFSGLARPQNPTFDIANPTYTEGGYYTVSYATFVVPLVNAVKELDALSEKLKVNSDKLAAENAALKAELERMKKDNATLKASVDKNSQDIEAIKAALTKKQN